MGVPIKFMTMRTAAVQPRILGKKNIFHLCINGGTQVRKFQYIKIFCMVLNILFVLHSYTCMYTKYNYTYKSMFFVLYPTHERKIGFIKIFFSFTYQWMNMSICILNEKKVLLNFYLHI